ncbi:MAG: hypothetical protein ABFD77_00870 [Thermotogota bacterium]
MKPRRLVCVAGVLILAVSLCSAAQAQKGYMDGYNEGRSLAVQQIRPGASFAGGFFLGIVYVAYSLLADGQAPSPAQMQSLPGSDDYKRGFLEGYKEEWKRIRTKNALYGWATEGVLVVAVYLVVYAALVAEYSYLY